MAAADGILAMSAYAQQLAGSELPDDCFGARIQRAVERGEIERSRCPMLFIDYLAPSLDTTISAIGNAVWLFATHPDQWRLLREDPDRVKAAFNEALRNESPISCFTRESAGQLAFGHGEHACVGMGLARLEGAAVLTALVERVGTISLAGPPVRKRNNLIRSFASLPVEVSAA